MGLDVSHDCWSGPYSAFGRFRESLARVAGVPLELMDGYYGRGETARYWEVTTVDAVPRPNHDSPGDGHLSEGIDEFMETRPDFAAWREEAKADGFVERRYVHPYVSRDGAVHHDEMVEIPRGPVSIVPRHLVTSLEWARGRGPDGPLSKSHLSPGLEDFIADIGRWLPLSWDLFPFRREPLTALLNHSDCGGTIGVRYQVALASRLLVLAALLPPRFGGHPNFKEGDEPRGIYDGVGEAAVRFAEGLMRAHAAREPVRFG